MSFRKLITCFENYKYKYVTAENMKINKVISLDVEEKSIELI